MRFSIIAVLSALSATAFGQASISDLPSCSQNCIVGGFASSGCSQVDIPCICKSSTYVNSLSCCVAQNCNTADQATTAKFAAALCASVGVTGLPTTASCSNSTSNSTSTTATSSTSSGAAASVTSAAASATASRSAAENLAQGLGFGAIAAGIAALFL